MRRLVWLLVLAAACNGTQNSELTFPAGKLEDFILHINRGSIRVRHATGDEKADVCLIKLTESGGEKTLGAAKRLSPATTERRIRLRQRRNERDLRLDIEVVVPKGVNLDLVVREGSIRLAGTYGRVAVVTTTGGVVAQLERCAALTVKALDGDLSVAVKSGRLEGDLRCETTRGDCSLTIGPDYRGPIQLFSGSAKIDLGDAPAATFRLGAEKKSARAFAGTPMSAEERVQAEKENRWPPGIWVKTQDGAVTFRVG